MFRRKTHIRDLLPPPCKASHGEYSMIFSSHDDVRPSESLVRISLQAVQQAVSLHLPARSELVNLWPGEHYRLLAAFVKVLQPKLIVEIGTATGLSALAMKEFLPKGGKIATFDLMPWHEHPKTVLQEKDFADGMLVQFTDNLAEKETASRHQKLLEHAELIFIDATHDGNLEKILLSHIESVARTLPLYVLFDDIRVWTMLKMWREIKLPKLDLTSFGHWSGTGIVEIK